MSHELFFVELLKKEIREIGDAKDRIHQTGSDNKMPLIVKEKLKNVRLHLLDAINEIHQCNRILERPVNTPQS